MRAGLLNKVVTFQTRSETSDGSGAGGTVTWTDALTAFAAIWPLKSSEMIEGARTKLNITHRIRTRYRSTITPSMRIKFGSRYFEINSIVNVGEANREIEILAQEKV